MHIIVDIRTENPQEILPIRTGIAWARLWSRYKKDDIITFLIHEHQEKVDGFNTIIVQKSFLTFGKKKIVTQKTNQIFRCINFSQFSPYDPYIPTVAYIWSNSDKLYGNLTKNIFTRKYNDALSQYTLRHSTGIIVPSIQVGKELVEIYNIKEDTIEIIPYFPVSDFSEEISLQNILTPVPFFIYDGSYGSEANILGLLSAWERYRSQGGIYELLLLGSAMDELSPLIQTIRSLDLSHSVRYLGSLDDATLHALYKKAHGWIYTGPYYSAGLTIEYTRAYRLPMLLSDITVFEGYSGIKVHPNHTADITKGLHMLESAIHESGTIHPETTYIQAFEKIFMKKV